MKKILYIFLALSFLGCDNDDKLADESVIIRNGEESQSLNLQNDLDKYLDETFANRITYRYYTVFWNEKSVEFILTHLLNTTKQ